MNYKKDKWKENEVETSLGGKLTVTSSVTGPELTLWLNNTHHHITLTENGVKTILEFLNQYSREHYDD